MESECAMAIQRIHILGASGSGTTTLGRALAERLHYIHFDTDAYFWLPTNPPFAAKRETTLCQKLLRSCGLCRAKWTRLLAICDNSDER